tara:strand:+ start:2927 stop:3142 length:216 start_codon:yes stop_codon:yes gene_type:complete
LGPENFVFLVLIYFIFTNQNQKISKRSDGGRITRALFVDKQLTLKVNSNFQMVTEDDYSRIENLKYGGILL